MNATNFLTTNLQFMIVTTNRPGWFSISNTPYIDVQAGTCLDVSGLTNWISGKQGEFAVSANQTLMGAGFIRGDITVLNSGKLVAGDTLTPNGHLVLSNAVPNNGSLTFSPQATTLTLSNAATTWIRLQRSLNPQNSKIIATNFIYGGTLNVTNGGATALRTGDPVYTGDSFTLFSIPANGGTRSGTFNGGVNLPIQDWETNAAVTYVTNFTYTWNNTLGTDGKITATVATNIIPLTGFNTTPTNITRVVYSNTLMSLSWPDDHTGWRLENQTNTLAVGVKSFASNWFTVSGSQFTNRVFVPIVRTNPTVFYRMATP